MSFNEGDCSEGMIQRNTSCKGMSRCALPDVCSFHGDLDMHIITIGSSTGSDTLVPGVALRMIIMVHDAA